VPDTPPDTPWGRKSAPAASRSPHRTPPFTYLIIILLDLDRLES